MENSTRRDHLKQLGGLFAGSIASSAALNSAAQAQSSVVPPEGIGYKINHLSYSDLGGRPDSVQVMKNKGHIYVGHMHSDGVTILVNTPEHTTCKWQRIYSYWQMAQTLWPCSPTTI